ncbi:MAG: hypothetical protein M1817_002403 [Caeruleum heppii]|nr:MAG: hypothetical protein M1817_002403 [Caeruleum heppii]
MVDSGVATRAPESDAAEDNVDLGVSPEEQPPKLGDHCTTDRPAPAGEHPSGEVSKIADIDVYITKPSDYPHSPSKLLLFLTNGVGLHSINNQLQADKYASEGFLVVMPDLFAGDPAPNGTNMDPKEDNPTIIEQVKLRAAETAKSFLLDMWLARNTSEKVMPILHKVIEGVKDEFADAVANGQGLYAVGYCFGGKYVLLLAGEHPDTVMKGQAVKDEEEGMAVAGPLIKAGAMAHGTLVELEDITSLKAPVSMACVEHDQLFPDAVRKEGIKHLEEKKIEHEVKVYSDVPHGFAVLGEYHNAGDRHIADAQKEAFQQMKAWLKEH